MRPTRFCGRHYLLVLWLVLTGCAGPTVHVFEQNLTEAELALIEQRLKAGGFTVRRNSIEPPAVDGPTLIYSPMLENSARVQEVELLMLELGWQVMSAPMTRGGHLYTKNNMGLYLSPDPPQRRDRQMTRSRFYGGVCNGQAAFVSFQDNGWFNVQLLDEESETVLTGTWEKAEHRLVLTLESGVSNLDYTTTSNGQFKLRNQRPSEPLSGCTFAGDAAGSGFLGSR